MNLTDFDYHLPQALIAQTPVEPRDSARLLVYERLTGTIRHHHVRDLPDILPKPMLIVANNSRVRHSRLWGQTTSGKKMELLLLEQQPQSLYTCIIGGVRPKIGVQAALFADQMLTQTTPLRAEVVAINPSSVMTTYTVRLDGATDLVSALETYAELPLPPYITERNSAPGRYQTVFAKETGSAAAPTAGLHFTPELIQTLQMTGHGWAEVTLHVGLGTFLPLRQEQIEQNQLHQEACYIDESTAVRLNQSSRVLAIGTTATRTLESHTAVGTVLSGWQQTDLFIYPGYIYQKVDALLTNFHLPKSSLLLLVAALLGNHPTTRQLMRTESEMQAELQRIYAAAIAHDYRFYSFGDAMLIL